MKTSIDFLPQEKQDELNRFVDFIKMQYPKKVEAVILYGSFARGTWVDDSYVEDGITYEYKSDYDIMIVVRHESKARDTKFTSDMRRRAKDLLNKGTPISLIFHGYDHVCHMLLEGHYFFVDIYNEGIVLYNRKDRPFREPGEVSFPVRVEKAEGYMEEWAGSADTFLKYFRFGMEMAKAETPEKHYKLASFQLHQATERYYMAILLIFTDYKPKTHDIEILSDDAIEYNSKFRHAFPRKTQEEEDLFQLLREAYIGSRYKKDFVITKEQLEYLAVRVEHLKKLTYEICEEHIERLRMLAGKEK